jgi:signal-transduction protein with cAMP-binding, CBS, and nucleotidyltransferase domain
MRLPPSYVNVGEIMTKRVETIKVINTAQEAAIKMTKKNVSSLAVVHEDGRPAGIVTERDLVRRICATDKISSKVKVQEIISSPVKTINADTSIGEAADIMFRNRIRHLLVTEADKKPIGIVSATDIVAYVRENNEAMMQVDKDVIRALEKEGRFYF